METQDTIREWRAATFGTSATTIRSAVRAQEELVEFLRALTSEQFDKARAEAADSMICLCGFADRTGERIDFRMSPAPAVNHERALSYAVRANEILARAIGLCAAGATVLEVADVARFVLAAGTWLGADMQAEIDAKMQINRGRVWKLDGSGHGYHVRTAEPVEISDDEIPHNAREGNDR